MGNGLIGMRMGPKKKKIARPENVFFEIEDFWDLGEIFRPKSQNF